MVALPGLGERGFRRPPACVIELGTVRRPLDGAIAALVARVEIAVARDEAATGSITIEDRRGSDGRWTAADAGVFRRWEPIRIVADFGLYSEEVFRGVITQITPAFPADAGAATLTVAMQDDGARLNREQMRRVWGETAPVTDLTILTTLATSAGLAPAPDSAQGQTVRALSQDATPIQFLRERARANGFEMIVAEGRIYFGPRRLTDAPQAPILVYAGTDTNCTDFTVEDSADLPEAVRVDRAPRDGGDRPETETLTPNEPLLGTTPVADEGRGLGTPSVWRLGREGDEDSATARLRAQALANDSAFKLRASGQLDGARYGHVLRVGRPVPVDGVGARYGGLYYVDSVTHALSPEGYAQQFQLMRNATGDSGVPRGPAGPGSALAGLFGASLAVGLVANRGGG